MIRFENTGFEYHHGKAVIDSVNLEVAAGEKICLLGLNGSGKSTLLKLAAGILRPVRGTVTVAGSETGDPKSAHRIRSRLGYIFQNPREQIVMTTVGADLAFTPENLGYPEEEIEALVNASASRFNLADLLPLHPSTLSAGEQQRTALAGVLAPLPEIILLDEPTSYLDYRGRSTLLDSVLDDPKLTVLAVTQFPREAERYDRVVLLHNGRVAFAGKIDQLLESSLWRDLNAKDNTAAPHQVEIDTEMAEASLVRAESVSFSYVSGRRVLDDVNLTAYAGGVTAIVGPSGSGKSTLGLLLAKLIEPESGRIEHGVRDGHSRAAGYLMQFPEAQFFAEEVRAEVAFGLTERGFDEAQTTQRVRDALSLVGIDYDLFSSRSPHTLSGGEQRRVAIASVLVMDPPVTILDEPTVALDWQGSRQLQRLMYRLRRSGKALILLSHDLDFVSRVATDIILIDKGIIHWSGSKLSDELPVELIIEQFGGLPDSLRKAHDLHMQGLTPTEIEDRLLSD